MDNVFSKLIAYYPAYAALFVYDLPFNTLTIHKEKAPDIICFHFKW